MGECKTPTNAFNGFVVESVTSSKNHFFGHSDLVFAVFEVVGVVVVAAADDEDSEDVRFERLNRR